MTEGSSLSLLFEIAADPSKAITATESFRDQASKAIKEFEDKMVESMTHSMAITKEFAIGMGIAAGAVAGLGIAMFELADKAAETGEKIFEMSEKTGLAAENISGLMAVTKETGGNFEALSTGLGRAEVNLTKIMAGAAGAHSEISQLMGGTKGLAELGLQPMDERLQAVLHRIFELNDVGERNRALQELMGRGWQENVESLKLLAEQGYGPAIEQAKKFGMFFDEASAQRAKQFRVEWEQTKAEFEALALTLGQKLVPAFNTVMHNIVTMYDYVKQYTPIITESIKASLGLESNLIKEIEKDHKSLGDVMKDYEATIAALVPTEKEHGLALDHQAKKIKELIPLVTTYQAIMNEVARLRMKDLDDDFKSLAQTLLTQVDPILEKINPIFNSIDLSAVKLNTDLLHQAIELRSLPELWQQVGVAIGKTDQAQTHYMETFQRWGSFASDALGKVESAMKQHHAAEVAVILARAGLRTVEETALGFAALGGNAPFFIPNPSAAALHFLSAAEYAILGGAQAAGVGKGSGGGASSGASSSSATAGLQQAPASLAPGAFNSGSGGTVHVIVSGSDTQVAAHITRLITNNVRYQGGQLTASHGLRSGNTL